MYNDESKGVFAHPIYITKLLSSRGTQAKVKLVVKYGVLEKILK
jgi:hypothetical protein